METTMTEFTIVIEDAGSNYAAYAPDVPGCIATGASIDEVTSTLPDPPFARRRHPDCLLIFASTE
jgi:hypothetical protein